MLDYTKAAVKKTIDDLKKVVFYCVTVSNLVYIAYLIYALIASMGNLIVNIILLVVTVAYLGFYLFATNLGKELDGRKTLKKNVDTVFNWTKKLVKVYTFGVLLYALASAGDDPSALYVILLAMQLMFFLLQVIFDVLKIIVEKRAQLFIDAFEADLDAFKKPFRETGNFFKRIVGKEVEEAPAPTKNQEMLARIVQESKEKREAEKAERKAEKLADKLARRAEKKAKKPVKVKTLDAESEVAASEELPALPQAEE